MKRLQSEKANVKVICRIRPTNDKEISVGGTTCVKFNDTGVDVIHDDGVNSFQFDRIFGPESDQINVFEYAAAPMINDVLLGYNATIFAYGQTGTGKTHTMEGVIDDIDLKGIIPRSVEALFDAVSEADENIEFTFKVTYVEIYMEKIRDLLDQSSLKTNLTVREDKIKGIYVAGVTEEYVTSHEEVLSMMSQGAHNRATAATGMNEGSSRSHSVFTVTVTQKDLSNNTSKSGKLVLVDLAGSEMVRKSNASGQQLEEAKTINKSLSALGQVIYALTDDKQTHIPYRDSKLTRILQDSLGGNSKTVLIVAVSPSSYNASETVSTLRFGMRAKAIENKVTVNQTRSTEELEALLVRAEKAIDAQTAHIMSLAAQLQALQAAGAAQGGIDTEANADASAAATAAAARLDAQETIIRQLEETIAQLSQDIEEERSESSRKDSEVEALAMSVDEKERLLHEAGELLIEAQKHYESQRERSELLAREKAAAVSDSENSRTQLEAELERARYELRELEVTVETLRMENKQMVKEIAEMSGDAAVERQGLQAPPPRPPSPDNSNRSGSGGGSSTEPSAFPPLAQQQHTRAVGGGGGGEGDARVGAVTMSALTLEERVVLAEQGRAQLISVCLEHGINSEAASALAVWMQTMTSQQEGLMEAFEQRAHSAEKMFETQSKRLKEMEVQRSRLEQDLQSRVARVLQLEVEIDHVRGTDTETAAQMLAERDKIQSKSLQQRLEQLVAVHRQLLRKFAMLELENGEFRKKIQLRDERIRQLETNSRSLTGNMRSQAEKHVSELTNLREQIQILRMEHQQRLESRGVVEAAAAAAAASTSRTQPGSATAVRGGDVRRSVRGGNHHGHPADSPEMPKSVRGGGGLSSSPHFSPGSPERRPHSEDQSGGGGGREDEEEEEEEGRETVANTSVGSRSSVTGTPSRGGNSQRSSGGGVSGLFSRVLGK